MEKQLKKENMKMKQGLEIGRDGTKRWYKDDKLHREGGPAVEYTDGTKEWLLNGKLHREDGPALECADGYKAWYINDKLHIEEEYNDYMMVRNFSQL